LKIEVKKKIDVILDCRPSGHAKSGRESQEQIWFSKKMAQQRVILSAVYASAIRSAEMRRARWRQSQRAVEWFKALCTSTLVIID